MLSAISTYFFIVIQFMPKWDITKAEHEMNKADS